MNKTTTRKLLMLLVGAYPQNFKLDESGVILASWEYHLKDFEFEACEKAVRAYIETGKEFPPTPGQIVSILRRWAIQNEKIGSWEEGFFVAERLARQYGKSHPKAAAEAAKTISPRLYLVIRQFGYRQLCELFPKYDGKTGGASQDDIKFARVRFEKLWREFTKEVEESGYIGHQQALGFASSAVATLVQDTAKTIGDGK